MVFWVVTPCSLVDGNQCFGGRAASIVRVEVTKEMHPLHCCLFYALE
jgi:hypothetical protein